MFQVYELVQSTVGTDTIGIWIDLHFFWMEHPWEKAEGGTQVRDTIWPFKMFHWLTMNLFSCLSPVGVTKLAILYILNFISTSWEATNKETPTKASISKT